MKRSASILLLATAASAMAAEPSAEGVRDGYLKFVRLTDKPKPMASQFAGWCTMSPGMGKAFKDLGPHAVSFAHYYSNEVAQRHLAAKGGDAFPPGTVFVKEKLYAGTAGEGADFTRITAVAGMIKRAPGTLPKSGDWEFFYFDRPNFGKDAKRWFKAADVSHCAGCHTSAVRDFVFARFDKPYVVVGDGTPGSDLQLQVAPGENLQIAPAK